MSFFFRQNPFQIECEEVFYTVQRAINVINGLFMLKNIYWLLLRAKNRRPKMVPLCISSKQQNGGALGLGENFVWLAVWQTHADRFLHMEVPQRSDADGWSSFDLALFSSRFPKESRVHDYPRNGFYSSQELSQWLALSSAPHELMSNHEEMDFFSCHRKFKKKKKNFQEQLNKFISSPTYHQSIFSDVLIRHKSSEMNCYSSESCLHLWKVTISKSGVRHGALCGAISGKKRSWHGQMDDLKAVHFHCKFKSKAKQPMEWTRSLINGLLSRELSQFGTRIGRRSSIARSSGRGST